MPDREDRLIMALGLGSTGQHYSQTPGPVPAGPAPAGPAPPAPGPPGPGPPGPGLPGPICPSCTLSYLLNQRVCQKDSEICHDYVEPRG